MKKGLGLLLLIGLPLLGGGGGYAAGLFLKGKEKPPADAAAAPPQTLQLGKFAVQIYHPATIGQLVTEAEVKVKAAGLPYMTSAIGLARLRDRAYTILFDAAETPDFTMGTVTAQDVANVLGNGLAPSFPDLVSVDILTAVTADSSRS